MRNLGGSMAKFMKEIWAILKEMWIQGYMWHGVMCKDGQIPGQGKHALVLPGKLPVKITKVG